MLTGENPGGHLARAGGGLRRVVVGRHAPRILPFLVAGLASQFVIPPDAGFGYGLGIVLPLALFICLVAGLVRLDGYAERQATRLTVPRPRRQYLLFSLVFVAIAVTLVLTTPGPSAHDQRWAAVGANSAAFLFLASGVFSLITLGRGASWGRARRLFWRTHRNG